MANIPERRRERDAFGEYDVVNHGGKSDAGYGERVKGTLQNWADIANRDNSYAAAMKRINERKVATYSDLQDGSYRHTSDQ